MREAAGVLIDRVKARTLATGWESALIANGRVIDGLGNILIILEDIREALLGQGEVEFYCDTGMSSKDFIETLKEKGMPCDVHGSKKGNCEGCPSWTC